MYEYEDSNYIKLKLKVVVCLCLRHAHIALICVLNTTSPLCFYMNLGLFFAVWRALIGHMARLEFEFVLILVVTHWLRLFFAHARLPGSWIAPSTHFPTNSCPRWGDNLNLERPSFRPSRLIRLSFVLVR